MIDHITVFNANFNISKKKEKRTVAKKPAKSPQRRKTAAIRHENEQSRFAEKMMLDQKAASIVGGTTGLLMLLDVMLHDAETENTNAFYFHADAYIHRLGRLETLLHSYEQLAVENPDIQQYRELLDVGKELQTLPPPEEITKEQLDSWREKTALWFDRYNEQEG